jgi:hypothetical protein
VSRLRVAALTVLVMGFAAAQLIPVARTNPPSQGDLIAPAPVVATLRRACFDCHSNATRWPWYSGVAPLSWMIVRHVTEGRRQLNFSAWSGYYPNTRRRKLQWIGRALRDDKMPPWSYALTHPDARLTDGDRAALEQWIEATLTGSSRETSSKGMESR